MVGYVFSNLVRTPLILVVGSAVCIGNSRLEIDIGGLEVGRMVRPKTSNLWRGMGGVFVVLVGSVAGLGNTIYVDDDGQADFKNIQAAINDADDGDTVLVADGTYKGPGNRDIDFLGKAITVRSENGPENSLIDCENDGRGFRFHTGERKDSIVSGFTITNGSTRGAGITCWYASPTIADCSIIRNTSTSFGGGIDCLGSSPIIVSCSIISNTAANLGGGIYCDWFSSPAIVNCAIVGNSAPTGGGIMCWTSSSPTITNCTIVGNVAGSGGGIYVDYAESSPTIANSILWGNTADQVGGFSYTIRYCDIDQSGHAGSNGNIRKNPLFLDVSPPDPANWNLQLQPVSHCIDAGDNTAVPIGITTDLHGLPRFVDGDCDDTDTVDIGAYEFLHSDIDRNGSVDLADLRSFALHWGDSGCGACGGADLTCDGNVDFNDLRELLANWLAGIE